MAKLPGQEKEIPLPLKHTDVQAAVAGYIATVGVTQQYHNPYNEKIEAVYVFPLPADAAVSEFVMTVGERKIRGIIRERQEAEKIYAEAKSQGYVASLLTQERPNIFTQSVANIEPGKDIDIDIKYFHTLAYDDGWYEFVFPMVVGPRFNPSGSTTGVGAISRGTPGRSGQQTEVQYLKPGERSGHDIALQVSIDAGVAIEQLDSRNHAVAVQRPAPEQAVVQLSPRDSLPNKDFVLRYKVAGERIKTAFVTHRDQRGGFFTLMVYPPDDLKSLQRQPMEMIFVLDCSGSMNGRPVEQAKAAAERALRLMRPDDTFQIIRFSNNASQLGPKPVEATPENVQRGLAYLKSLQGEGGTMMIEGIKAALDFPHDPRRIRTVAFLTDGYIGNELEIFAAVHQKLGASRIFSFGVGTSVNRYLLDGLARLGKGAVAYLGLNDDPQKAMDLYFERISHPALTDVAIDWGTLGVSDVYPQRIPDLFVGRPIVLTGRFTGERPTTIHIRGRAGNVDSAVALVVNPTDGAATHAGLAAVWARLKIADLSDRAATDPGALARAEASAGADSPSKAAHAEGAGADWPGEIKAVALEYGLMSAYTAFVAVDSMTRTAGDHGTTVIQAVPVPDGVKYETTVSEGENRPPRAGGS
jgi:Ca-activated chloride channel family protein